MKDPDKRVGSKGVEELVSHPWFSGFPWQRCLYGRMPPPWVPDLIGPTDMRYFDVFPQVDRNPKPTIQNLSLLAFTSRISRFFLLPTPHPLQMPYTLALKTLHVLSRASSLPLVPHRAQHHAPKTCQPENFDANFRSYRAGLMRATQRQGHCSKPTTRLGNHRSRCSPRGIACMA